MVKMFHTCVDDTLQHFSVVEKHPRLSHNLPRYQNMKLYQGNLRMYRMLLWCIPDAAVDADLLADLNSLAASIAQPYILDAKTDSFALPPTEYNSLILKVDEKRQKCLDQVTKYRYRRHLISSFLCEADEPSCFTSNRTMEFLDSVHAIFIDHLRYIDKTINRNLYNQIQSLVESTLLLRDLVYYTNPQTDSTLRFIVHDWANKAACFSLLYWLFGIEDETNPGLLIDLKQKVDPCNTDFIKLCFQVIKAPKMKCEDRLLFGEFVSRLLGVVPLPLYHSFFLSKERKMIKMFHTLY